jgi:hypothetical protein
MTSIVDLIDQIETKFDEKGQEETIGRIELILVEITGYMQIACSLGVNDCQEFDSMMENSRELKKAIKQGHLSHSTECENFYKRLDYNYHNLRSVISFYKRELQSYSHLLVKCDGKNDFFKKQSIELRDSLRQLKSLEESLHGLGIEKIEKEIKEIKRLCSDIMSIHENLSKGMKKCFGNKISPETLKALSNLEPIPLSSLDVEEISELRKSGMSKYLVISVTHGDDQNC